MIIDHGVYYLEHARDKNIQLFIDTLKALQYEDGELFMHFRKTAKDTRNDVWNNLVGKDYKYDSSSLPGLQTTVVFKEAPKKYQEGIVNKVRLRNVHIRYMQVGGK